MKCTFCACELHSGVAEGTLICPNCDLHVYMGKKIAMPGKGSPNWLRDSFNLVRRIGEFKPDIVLGTEQLFTDSFTNESVTMVFANKNAAQLVPVSIHVTYYRNNVMVPKWTNLLAFRGVMSYKFHDVMEASMNAAPKCNRVPLICADNVDVTRWMWHVLCCDNIMAETQSTGVVDILCRPSMLTKVGTMLTDDLAAAVAGFHRFSRMREIGCADGNWFNAVAGYAEKASNMQITEAEYSKAITNARGPRINSGSSQFLHDIVLMYKQSTPSMFVHNSKADDITLFDPECLNCVDTTPIDVAVSKGAGKVYETEMGRYKIYTEIWKSLISASGEYEGESLLAQQLGGGGTCPRLLDVLES